MHCVEDEPLGLGALVVWAAFENDVRVALLAQVDTLARQERSQRTERSGVVANLTGGDIFAVCVHLLDFFSDDGTLDIALTCGQVCIECPRLPQFAQRPCHPSTFNNPPLRRII